MENLDGLRFIFSRKRLLNVYVRRTAVVRSAEVLQQKRARN